MSSILKALKKLEDEKTARRRDPFNIDAEILRDDRPPRYSLLGVSLLAGLLFVCGGGATYLYMQRTGGTPSGSPAPSPPAAAAPAAAPPENRIGSESVRPGQAPPPRPKERPGKVSPPPAPARRPADAKPGVKPAQAAAAAGGPAALRPAAAGMAPLVKVNGIAFQDGGADSVAVVNGIPVSGGSVIEGARVEEIRRDRVRFSHDGETFEVLLGGSNR